MEGPLAHHRQTNPSVLRMSLDIAESGTAFRVEEWGKLLGRVEQEVVEGTAENGSGEDKDLSEENLPENQTESVSSFHLPTLYLRRVLGTVGEQLKWSRNIVKAFPFWEPEELGFQKSVQNAPADLTATRFYAGMSHGKKGWEQDCDDLKAGKSARYTSLISSNGLRDRVEHFHFRLTGNKWIICGGGGAKLRESIIIQGVEEVAIAVLGKSRFNSASGGL